MRGWLAAVLAVTVSVLFGLTAGCKGGPGAPGAQRPTAAPKAAAGDQHDHGEKDEHGKEEPGLTYDAVLKRLQSASDTDKQVGLRQMSQLMSAEDRARLRDAVRKLTADANPDTQAIAIDQWAPWVREEPAPALNGAKSPHAAVRLAAVKVLSGGRPEDVRETLTKLKSDPDSSIAMQAAAALGNVLATSKGDEAIDALIADLGNQEADRSAQAGMRLEQMARGNRRVIDRLMRTLETSPKAAQRMSCVVVIGLASSGSSEKQVTFAARTRAYSRTGADIPPAYTVPVPLLMKTVEGDPDGMVREAAAEALGLLGDARSARSLGKALRDPDQGVRRRAAEALIIVPPDAVKDDLVAAAAKDPSAEVRRFAVEAMAGLPREVGAPLVAQCVNDRDTNVRRYAAETLGRIGSAAQTQVLLPLFKDPDEDVRWKAVEAVSNFVDKQSREALVEALWDPSARVALAAERGLHGLGIGRRVLTAEERRPAKAATR